MAIAPGGSCSLAPLWPFLGGGWIPLLSGSYRLRPLSKRILPSLLLPIRLFSFRCSIGVAYCEFCWPGRVCRSSSDCIYRLLAFCFCVVSRWPKLKVCLR